MGADAAPAGGGVVAVVDDGIQDTESSSLFESFFFFLFNPLIGPVVSLLSSPRKETHVTAGTSP